MRVMLVEDDKALRAVLAAFLRSTGIDVVACPSDGQEALDLLESLRPDMILTDCQMPRMDGISMVRRLRARGDHTPVIMMSGLTDPAIHQLAYQAGISHCLEKPLSLSLLNEVMDLTLRGSAA